MKRLLLALTVAWAPLAAAAEAPRGLVTPIDLAPFDAAAPACAMPPHLTRKLVFVQDNERAFMGGVGHGLKSAAADRGLAYDVALADNDPELMARQVEALTAARTGAIVAAPIDPPSLAPKLRAYLATGAYVGAVVPPPATTLLNAPQYLTGRRLGEAAADYIRTKLGGVANVVLLTHDSLEFLAPRFAAMRDVLQELPGVVIVADISPTTVDKAGGYATMNMILVANPTVDVVLGADTVVLGALQSLREAGKARDDQFLGGIDGEPEAIAEIQKGGPYKTTVALNSPVFGYALGQMAADWLDGKSVPQAMDILPSVIAPDTIAQYQADLADPATVYADPARRDAYLKMYGNICYDTRARFVDFAWSSEKPR
jgi:ribose transport system substrate-binding protein